MRTLALYTVALSMIAGCGDGSPSVDPADQELVEILHLEDSRPDAASRAPLVEATQASDVRVQVAAVRALGRLEDPAVIVHLERLLGAGFSHPEVRAEAFNAIAQSVFGNPNPTAHALLRRWTENATAGDDPLVRGALVRSFGRLALLEGEDPVERARVMLAAVPDEAPEALRGAAHGLYYLGLASRGEILTDPEVRRWLMARISSADDPTRRVAALALSLAEEPDAAWFPVMLTDALPTVRRAAVGLLGPDDADMIVEALADPDATVRVQAVRVLRRVGSDAACEHALGMLHDESHHVRMAGLQWLANPCDDAGVRSTLVNVAEAIDSVPPGGWHEPTRALLSLAAVAPAEAARLLPSFVSHSSPFVRAHAASAAQTLGQEAVLRSLLDDPSPNVKTAALQGLARLVDRAALDAAAEMLGESDAQLVVTAAGLWREDDPVAPGVVDAALASLERFSAAGRDTDRDPRLALLGLIEQGGGPDRVDALRPYLTDYDPAVAERVAGVLRTWTEDEGIAADPRPGPGLEFPSADEFVSLRDTRVVLEMERGGEITIAVLPDEAPTNAARFVRLARSGHFDGLTFHRIVTNFIIQGGSPSANEYHGDGPFSRDELGMRSHWRGTVGLSTRGRDTGDGQIFINTVPNLRLDHNYTIFGIVEEGMEVVDDVREGDVILRARVVEG